MEDHYSREASRAAGHGGSPVAASSSSGEGGTSPAGRSSPILPVARFRAYFFFVYTCFLLISPFEFGSKSLVESTVLNILMFTLAPMALILLTTDSPGGRIHLPLHLLLVWAWVLWCNATVLYSVNRYLSVYQGTKLLVFGLGCLLPFLVWRDERDYLRTYRIFLVSVLVFVLYGFFQHAHGLTELSGRINSIFITPNTLAAYLNVGFFPALALFLTAARWMRWIYLAYLALTGAATVYTGSIGGWLGLMVGLGLFSILFGVRPLLSRLRVPLLSIAVAAAGTVAFGQLPLGRHVQRIWEMQGSGVTRLFIWESAIQGAREYPFWGSGLATFHLLHARLKDLDLFKNLHHFFVHNDYLQAWVETGVPGLLLLIGWIAALYVFVFRSCRVGFARASQRSAASQSSKTRPYSAAWVSPDPAAVGRSDADRAAHLMFAALASLTAVFAQSAIDFNLVIPAILNACAFNIAFISVSGGGRPIGVTVRVPPIRWTGGALAVLSAVYLAVVGLLCIPLATQTLEARAFAFAAAKPGEEQGGGINRAIALQEWSVRLFPWNAQARQSLSRYYSDAAVAADSAERRRDWLEKAEMEARRAVELGPEEFSNYWWLARLIWKTPELKGRMDEAEVLMERARAHNPGSQSTTLELFQFYKDRERWRKIILLSVEYTGRHPEALARIARFWIPAYFNLGLPSAAEELTDRLLAQVPESAFFLLWKGRLRVQTGDLDAGRRFYLQSLDRARSRRDLIYRELEQVERMAGRLKNAEEYGRLAEQSVEAKAAFQNK